MIVECSSSLNCFSLLNNTVRDNVVPENEGNDERRTECNTEANIPRCRYIPEDRENTYDACSVFCQITLATCSALEKDRRTLQLEHR